MTKRDLNRRAHQTLLWTVIAGITAAASGDLESLYRLAVKGLNINDSDYDRRTPLHLAAQAGHMEVVHYLVEQGADINAMDRWDATPLNDAANDEIKTYLLSKGAKKGKEQPKIALPVCSINDEQFQLFYAAHQNDILLM
jgi:hypothetical protein